MLLSHEFKTITVLDVVQSQAYDITVFVYCGRPVR